MTELEFESLKPHDRIRCVRIKNPSVYENMPEVGKAYIITWIHKYTNQAGNEVYTLSGWARNFGELPKSVVEDWELVERRDYVEVNRRSKLGRHYAQKQLEKFRQMINEFIQSHQKRFDAYCNDMRLDHKLKFLAGLEGIDRLTAEIFFECKNAEDLIKTWDKGRIKEE